MLVRQWTKVNCWVCPLTRNTGKAGIIAQSVSPWASPIVVVPVQTESEEPPRRMLCVDYQVLNNWYHQYTKHSKAKGVLTLVPSTKIDDMYAKLGSSSIFSPIDLRGG